MKEKAVKGPHGRLKFDVRRIWECPKCHQQLRTTGQVVTCLCEGCSSIDPPVETQMFLVEEVHESAENSDGENGADST